MTEEMPELATPATLKLRLHLSRNWTSYTIAGVATMPLAIETGTPLAGTAGYLCAVAAINHAPRTLWRRLAAMEAPLKGILLVIAANTLLRSITRR